MFSAWKGNLYWMLFALGLSTILWMVISGQQNPYREDIIQNVVVEVQNVPPGLVLRSGRPAVAARVSAPLDVWRTLQPSSLRAYVDASKATAGHQDLPVKVEASDWRVRVESWQPSSVGVQFEVAKKKDVPVKVNVIGEVPFGFASRPATVSPQQVTVSGPESVVSRVSRAVVDIKLLDARATVNQQLAPIPVDDEGSEVKGVATAPEMVAVEVPIEQQVSYKTVAVVPRVVGSVALGYQLVGVMVEPTAVTIVGDPNALRDLNYLPTLPVNVSGAVADVTINTELDLPASVSVVRKQGIIVRAYVGAAEGSQTVTVAPVVIGLGKKLVGSPVENKVEVTVAGPMPLLNTLKAQDVRVELDASGLGPGTHLLTPTINLPEALKLVRVVPDSISVVIK